MISNDTKNKIVETSRIEEVVGDFVSLKKRGVNLLGLCPFHNEKTPSFTVSPAKGIYKCFGCGKAGDSVTFVMEHEHYTFPEALKYLAQKYHIEVEETAPSPEQLQQQDDRESLYVITSFAQKFYSQKLTESEEGKAIGLTYFEERGFHHHTIEKFQLGYSGSKWDEFTQAALQNGFDKKFLIQSGLTILKEEQQKDSEQQPVVSSPSERVKEKFFDRFRSRVIFPVHNLSGRIIGFGGRILTADPKQPKYVNSPESEIYNKSKSLYGIFFAKKSIIQNDECFLAEGYTDVISLHQSGIENAVASSGTSLTQDQIRLIGRFTKNVTILYDGDFAGIKASMRGIDLILEEGLNVKVVLFPDGNDPDSYAKKVSSTELQSYVKSEARDFIAFKTGLLLKEVANDPVKKAGLIKDIVASISKIPDGIIRSTYIKQCSVQMEIAEQVLVSEMNKLRREAFKKQNQEEPAAVVDELFDAEINPVQPLTDESDTWHQEKELIRLLMNYGTKEFFVEPGAEEEGQEPVKYSVRDFIVSDLQNDEIELSDTSFAKIFNLYCTNISELNQQFFFSHEEEKIKNLAIDLMCEKYELSPAWESKGIFVKHEDQLLRHAVMSTVYMLKIKRVQKLKKENQEEIKRLSEIGEDVTSLIEHQRSLEQVKSELTKYLGIVVVK